MVFQGLRDLLRRGLLSTLGPKLKGVVFGRPLSMRGLDSVASSSLLVVDEKHCWLLDVWALSEYYPTVSTFSNRLLISLAMAPNARQAASTLGIWSPRIQKNLCMILYKDE